MLVSMPGSPPSVRHLIVNADDLGLSENVNAGVFVAHEEGIVTSASLMVRQGAAELAAKGLVRHPELAVGLHLDFSQRDYEIGAPLEILPAPAGPDARRLA